MATEQRREELVRISLTCKGGRKYIYIYNPPLWEKYVWKTGRLHEFPRLQGFSITVLAISCMILSKS